MNIQNITAFLAIVHTGTISKAAQELYLTQSAVSHRLKSLEDEINAQLIIRCQGRQGIKLTAKGEEFIPIAERWLSLLQDTHRLSAGNNERVYLSIASVDSLNVYLFPPLYRRLMQIEDPRLSLRIRTHQSNEIYRLLEQQKIDVGFVLRPIILKNVYMQEILRERMVLIRKAQNNADNNMHTVSVSELNPAKEFFINWSPAFRVWHERWWPNGLCPELYVDTAALILKLMEEEDCWSIIPLSMAREFQKTGGYQIYQIQEEPPERVIYKLVHKFPRPSRLAAMKLLDKYLEDFLQELSDGQA